MPSFVRGNIAVCTVTFTATDGTTTQPSSADLYLNYTDQVGDPHQTAIPMTQVGSSNVWAADWNTQASGEGTVFWAVYGYGSLQAADEGEFQVRANAANNV